MAAGFAQISDLYSDLVVTYLVYYLSLAATGTPSEDDYQIALIICFLSLASTFMACQSCIIGMKFAQGDFEPQNFRSLRCFNKLLNMILLTFVGASVSILMELLDNACRIFKVFGLTFGGTKGVQRIDGYFIEMKARLTGLNAYQLHSIEEQRRVYSLVFENVPFTLLLMAIWLRLLDCDELLRGQAGKTVIASLIFSLIQVAITVLKTFIQSRWLSERTLSYLMTKMTANNNWIPFIHLIT